MGVLRQRNPRSAWLGLYSGSQSGGNRVSSSALVARMKPPAGQHGGRAAMERRAPCRSCRSSGRLGALAASSRPRVRIA